VIERLVAVHGVRFESSPAFVDDLSIAKRDELVAGLDNTDVPWDTGPFGEPARHLFVRHADAVRRLLDRYDRLATNVRRRSERMVVTHGEPHRGNTITTAAGVVLIDWDTALMAPPERDLWSLAGEDPAVIDAYRARTGTPIDPEAIEAYRLSWDLSEIAICGGRFLREHTDQEDARTDWTVLQRYLDPARWA
jgi:spectinomycin phosphotransferase/16S rRNA (guanine(1405)-N(7))-methyltransferase